MINELRVCGVKSFFVHSLEKSGLKEGVNFFEQGKGFNLKNEEGRPLKPDVLIKMPSDGEDKSEVVIVDSKVSLAAYNDM